MKKCGKRRFYVEITCLILIILFCVPTVKVKAATRSSVVNIAKKEVGTQGIPNKYTYDLGKINGTYAYAWCHAFVSWCAKQAGAGNLMPRTASCANGVTWFKNRGKFRLRSSGYVPQPGDIIYFGTNGSSHVGIVNYFSGGRVYTIEGNARNAVKINGGYSNGYSQQDTYIYGYGCPDYSDGHNPVGSIDAVSDATNAVRVRGWAFDEDNTSRSIDIHVYIGGPAGVGECHAITANVQRTDVNSVHGCGNNHGFDARISTGKTGTQDIYIYAIN